MAHNDTQAGVKQFVSIYKALNKRNLTSLETLYHPEIVFRDPAHEIVGLAASFSILLCFMRMLLTVNLLFITPRSKTMTHLSPGP